MRVLILFLFCLGFSINSTGQNDTLRVLFLGNSYTYVNNLPLLCEEFATHSNHKLITETNTPGGYTLESHSENTTSIAKIKEGIWDFVVLQEQSQIPTIDYYRYNSMYPAAHNLKDSIKLYNPCATIVMFMTWGRRFGGIQCDNDGVYCSPDFVDFHHMQDSLASAYLEIGQQVEAIIAPIGISWGKVISNSELVLHSGDNSHPSYMGTYLAAANFHSVFWKESILGNSFNGDLEEETATFLQSKSDSVIFHSTQNWNMNINETVAEFSYIQLDNTIKFSNLSNCISEANYLWDFGDGNSSSEINPIHQYEEAGDYLVKLSTNCCGTTDSTTQIIHIEQTVSLNQLNSSKEFQLYPNPAKTSFQISSSKNLKINNVQILDSSSNIIENHYYEDLENIQYNIEHLKTGIYFLRCISKHHQETHKLIIL